MLFLETWENEREASEAALSFYSREASTALILHRGTFQPLRDDSSAPEIAGIETALEELPYDIVAS
jgi:hypothetical protein